MPQISVIIPTFNRSSTLLRAIDSVLKQSFLDFDLWVVDDGSTDSTQELVTALNHPKIKYIKTKNMGVSAARNIAIERSTSPWKAFLDSDDEWLVDRLQSQMDLLHNNPTLKIIHGEEIWIRNGVRVNQMKKHAKCGGWIFTKCLPLCLISPSAVLIHQDIFSDVGLFNPDFTVCEDYDLWLRITHKYEVGFVEWPIIKKYGGHEDQLSAKFKAMDYWRVKALERILSLNDLNDCDRTAVITIIQKKCQILLNGYKKHNNMANYQEILGVLSSLN